jgi:hypothetical protein
MSTEITTTTFADIPSKIDLDPAWLEARQKLLAKSTAITTVTDQDSYEDAEVILSRITKGSNQMEAFRKKFGAPFLDATRLIKKIADDARAPMESEKRRLKGMMTPFLQEQNRKRQEEIERQAAEEARLKMEAEKDENPFAEEEAERKIEQAPVKPVTQEVRRSMSNVITTWTFEIENPHNVPREYCKPDEALIRAAVTKGGNRSIPGVRIFEKTDVRSR